MKNRIRILMAVSCLMNLSTGLSFAQVIPYHKIDTIILVQLSTKWNNGRPVSSYIIVNNEKCITKLFCGSVLSLDSLKQYSVILFEPYLGFMQMFKYDANLNYKDQKKIVNGLKKINKKMKLIKTIIDEKGLLVSIYATSLIADFWVINKTSHESSYISDSYLSIEEVNPEHFLKLRKIIRVPSIDIVSGCQ